MRATHASPSADVHARRPLAKAYHSPVHPAIPRVIMLHQMTASHRDDGRVEHRRLSDGLSNPFRATRSLYFSDSNWLRVIWKATVLAPRSVHSCRPRPLPSLRANDEFDDLV